MHRRVLPEVALEAHRANAPVAAVQALERRKGAVGGAVVDEDQLERARAGIEHGDGPAIELLDGAGLVVERDDYREIGRRELGVGDAASLHRLGAGHGQSICIRRSLFRGARCPR